MSERVYIPIAATVLSNRIGIPKLYGEHLPWLKSQDSAKAWLLGLEPGRLRLLSSAQIENSPELRLVAGRITNPGSPDLTVEPFDAERPDTASLVARLTPVVLSLTEGPGWRMTVPKHSFPMVSMSGEGKVFFLLSEGYLEIWTPERLTRATATPITQLLE